MSICCIDNCDNKANKNGICGKHATRLYQHQDFGTNYKERANRISLNDLSTFDPRYVTEYERQALREMFFRGKYHGTLTINYSESISVE